MIRLRGRALRGQRVADSVPHGHWKTTTLISALDLRGICCSLDLDGALNGLAFQAFVERLLIPTLRPGDLVMLGHLSSHKGTRVAELVRGAHAELVYLPPHSPDLNPIEMAFSKVKQALRSLAVRTIDELWGCMQSVLDRVTPADAAGFFQHCGYTLQIK
jgi:transposase